jgi:hypothetical protein
MPVIVTLVLLPVIPCRRARCLGGNGPQHDRGHGGDRAKRPPPFGQFIKGSTDMAVSRPSGVKLAERAIGKALAPKKKRLQRPE